MAAPIRTRVTSCLVRSYRKEIALIATESNQQTKLPKPTSGHKLQSFNVDVDSGSAST